MTSFFKSNSFDTIIVSGTVFYGGTLQLKSDSTTVIDGKLIDVTIATSSDNAAAPVVKPPTKLIINGEVEISDASVLNVPNLEISGKLISKNSVVAKHLVLKKGAYLSAAEIFCDTVCVEAGATLIGKMSQLVTDAI